MGILKKWRKRRQRQKLLQQLQHTTAPLIHIWRQDTNNIGDIACTPSLYFEPLNTHAHKADIMLFEHELELEGKTIIVGGGGLILPYFEKALQNILKLGAKNKLIFWGVGYDNYIGDDFFIPFKHENTLAIGLRDYGELRGCDYTPCPSCLSPLFEKHLKQESLGTHALYLHGHYSRPIAKDLAHLPTAYNTEMTSLDEALEFIASYDVILTNSYHGLYWATLLNKQVIVIPWIDAQGRQGFSHKFTQFRYKAFFLEDWNNYKQVEQLCAYPHALEECREDNKAFFENKVLPQLPES